MLIGVVGKANVGKSTFFKAATLMDVEIANYPFATVKPNHGVGFTKLDCVDKELNVKCSPKVGFCKNSKRFVAMDMLDVAGLVPGAHEGKGMGLEFLNDLNQADALIHVIDVAGTTNEKGEPIQTGSYNPADDILFLEDELDYWYLSILKKPWDKFSRQVSQEKEDIVKAILKQFSGVGATEDIVKTIVKKLSLLEKTALEWTEDELLKFSSELRKATKPMIIAANKIDVPGAQENLKRLQEQFHDYIIVPCSSESELALKEADKHGLIEYIAGEKEFKIIGKLSEKQEKALEFIKSNILEKLGSTGVQAVLDKAVFKLLNLIAVYPVANSRLQDNNGNVLPDSFLVPAGITAHEFAYKVHTDIGEKFIKAVDMKKKITIGKDHVMQHRDVVEIIADR